MKKQDFTFLLLLVISSLIYGQKLQAVSTNNNDIHPLFSNKLIDGDATLKGKIKGYIPKEKDAITIETTNPITNLFKEYLFDINIDGTFECKIPLVSTTSVRFECLGIDNRVILSPLENTQIYIDLKKKEESPESLEYIYFEGANADFNNQLFHKVYTQIDISNPVFNKQFRKDIAGMTLIQYRDCLYDLENKKLKEIDQLEVTQDVKKYLALNLKYITLFNLIENNKILDEEPYFDKEYHAYLKDLPINEMVLLYPHSINLLQHIDKLISLYTLPIHEDNYDEVIEMKVVSPEDEKIIELMKLTTYRKASPNVNSDDLTNNIKTLETLKKGNLLKRKNLHIAERLMAITEIKTDREYHNYEQLILNFDRSKVINDSVYNELGISPLKNPEVSFTEKEKSILHDKIKTLLADSQSQEMMKDILFISNNKEYLEVKDIDSRTEMQKIASNIESVIAKYKTYFEIFPRMNRQISQIETFREISGVEQGLMYDLMYTQFICKKMEQKIPLTEADFKFLEYKLDNPFYVQYLTRINNELLAKIEEDKANVYNVHQTPTNDNDKLLHEILKPHQGKVIFLDFWNTWCAPCRDAMNKFTSTKDSYKDKGVVFVYLADESSPETAWNNMIPSIGGEHYRLSKEQMTYLRKKFGFRGIPSYAIFDKKGELTYFRTGFEGAEKLAKIIDTELEK